MGMLNATVTVTQQLTPSQKARLAAHLKLYNQVQDHIKQLEAQLKEHREALEELHLEAGGGVIDIDGNRLQQVTATRQVLNKERLLSYGITTQQLTDAYDPATSTYLKITKGAK
jgi:hypothetical protein